LVHRWLAELVFFVLRTVVNRLTKHQENGERN
jgi:hypothetical protein